MLVTAEPTITLLLEYLADPVVRFLSIAEPVITKLSPSGFRCLLLVNSGLFYYEVVT
jgi:hypothetical protein